MNSDCEVLCCLYFSAEDQIKSFNTLLKQEYSAALTYVVASQLRIAKQTKQDAKSALERMDVSLTELKESAVYRKPAVQAAKQAEKDEMILAEALIKDTTAHVIYISRSLNEYSDCSASVKRMAEKTIELDNLFMARLRGFL
ncbi:hypothetical protein [Acetanaerobacterium elongatum]|uniref:Uncharacterized protein n=1 Tax=Acetanaerobacterium elongatum TaxID=258515 RepID=A0A1G9X1C7_9FIRM|nr:hypothetical protein [Acetanaerobacterium elongatum]SDM90512.1 hypothetical protein SAMN05192585_10759 [Acetanaerobacterium elongatum]